MRAKATEAVKNAMRIEANLATAVLEDVCRRARARWGI